MHCCTSQVAPACCQGCQALQGNALAKAQALMRSQSKAHHRKPRLRVSACAAAAAADWQLAQLTFPEPDSPGQHQTAQDSTRQLQTATHGQNPLQATAHGQKSLQATTHGQKSLQATAHGQKLLQATAHGHLYM